MRTVATAARPARALAFFLLPYGLVSETLPTQTLFHVPAPGGRWSDSLRGAVISFSLHGKFQQNSIQSLGGHLG